MAVRLKRAYEPASREDGTRYLIDRRWPRGLTSQRLALTAWRKDLAASEALCRWYDHELPRYPEFRARYRAELEGRPGVLAALRAEAERGIVTLVYAARDGAHSNASVLLELLDGSPGPSAPASSGPGPEATDRSTGEAQGRPGAPRRSETPRRSRPRLARRRDGTLAQGRGRPTRGAR